MTYETDHTALRNPGSGDAPEGNGRDQYLAELEGEALIAKIRQTGMTVTIQDQIEARIRQLHPDRQVVFDKERFPALADLSAYVDEDAFNGIRDPSGRVMTKRAKAFYDSLDDRERRMLNGIIVYGLDPYGDIGHNIKLLMLKLWGYLCDTE